MNVVSPSDILRIIIIGSTNQHPQLNFLQKQLQIIAPITKVHILNSSKMADIIADTNLNRNSLFFLLDRTSEDVASWNSHTPRNNIIYYIKSPNKNQNTIQVSNRWHFYRIVLKRIGCWFKPSLKKTNKAFCYLGVKVLRRQNQYFNCLMEALFCKYQNDNCVNFQFIEEVKIASEGQHQKRILIVNICQLQYAKTQLQDNLIQHQKLYTILFQGNICEKINFSTFKVRDIQLLLDSVTESYKKKIQTSPSRIKMKSVKKISKNQNLKNRGKLIVIQSNNAKFKQIYKNLQFQFTIAKSVDQITIFEKTIILADYNQSSQILSSLPLNNLIYVVFYTEFLTPNNLIKHPAVKLITDNQKYLVEFLQTNLLLKHLQNFTSEPNPNSQKQMTESNYDISSFSTGAKKATKLLNKCRGVYPNGQKFMGWDTKAISPGVFCTYPEDEVQNIQKYLLAQNPNIVQNCTLPGYTSFDTFGKLRHSAQKNSTNYNTKLKDNVLAKSPDYIKLDSQNNLQQHLRTNTRKQSIIQQLIQLSSKGQINMQQEFLPKTYQLNGQVLDNSNRQLIGNIKQAKQNSQVRSLPFQSLIASQKYKGSRIEFSQSDNSQLNRNTNIASFITNIENPPLKKLTTFTDNVQEIPNSRQNQMVKSFLTMNIPSISKVNAISSRSQLTQSIYPNPLKRQKQLQTEEQSYISGKSKLSQIKLSKSRQLQLQVLPKAKEKQMDDARNKILNRENIVSPQSQQYIQAIQNRHKDSTSKSVQLIFKKSIDYLQVSIELQFFVCFSFFTNAQLRQLSLKLNPDLKTILIIDQVPECIQYFDVFSLFQCIVIPMDRLFEKQRKKYPHFKWITQKNKKDISPILEDHLNNLKIVSSIENIPLSVLYFYDEVELQQELRNELRNSVLYIKYHNFQSLLSHIKKAPLVVILNQSFEWAYNEIHEKNPQAFVIIYSSQKRVLQNNVVRNLMTKKEEVVEFMKRIKK